jgi:hypothetical protein
LKTKWKESKKGMEGLKHLKVSNYHNISDYNGEPVGPQRVWLKTDDIPGLAMSR